MEQTPRNQPNRLAKTSLILGLSTLTAITGLLLAALPSINTRDISSLIDVLIMLLLFLFLLPGLTATTLGIIARRTAKEALTGSIGRILGILSLMLPVYLLLKIIS